MEQYLYRPIRYIQPYLIKNKHQQLTFNSKF